MEFDLPHAKVEKDKQLLKMIGHLIDMKVSVAKLGDKLILSEEGGIYKIEGSKSHGSVDTL